MDDARRGTVHDCSSSEIFFYKTHQNLIIRMTSVEEMLEQDVVVTVLCTLVTMPLLCVGLQVHNQGRGEAG